MPHTSFLGRKGSLAVIVFAFALLISTGNTAAQNVGIGSPYAELDAQADRTVTDFGSVRAISVRGSDGSLGTTLETVEGKELARMFFSQTNRYFDAKSRSGQGPRFEAPPGLSVTADWANAQLFSLWRDGTKGMALGLLAAPVFDGYFFRHPALASAGDSLAKDNHRLIVAAMQRVRSEFPTVIAEAVRNSEPSAVEKRSGTIYSTFTTRISDRSTDKSIGILQWFPAVQTLSWKLHGKDTNFISPERLAQAGLSGWPFEPNLPWSNLQLYSIFKDSEVAVRAATIGAAASIGAFAEGPGPDSIVSSASTLPRVAFTPGPQVDHDTLGGTSRIVGAVCTNEADGCTGLHWLLDGSIFRPCCDEHDRCFYKNREECCTFWSWFFPWQQGWSCAECNVNAVWCFLTGGGGGDGGGGSGGPNEENECHLDINEYFCSAECSSCTGGAWPNFP